MVQADILFCAVGGASIYSYQWFAYAFTSSSVFALVRAGGVICVSVVQCLPSVWPAWAGSSIENLVAVRGPFGTGSVAQI